MLVALLAECYDIQFDLPQQENTNANVYVVMTSRGVMLYGQLNFILAFQDLVGQNLGNFSFEVGGFSFNLNNMIITDMENPSIDGIFSIETQEATVDFSDFRMLFEFDFSFTQDSFPFLSDAGTGKIDISLEQLLMPLSAKNSEACPGEFSMGSGPSVVRMGRLKFVLKSDYSFILNAIMPLLENYLVGYFEDVIGSTMGYFLVNSANARLDLVNPIASLENTSLFIQDQRWVGDPVIYDRQFSVAANGMACLYDAEAKLCKSGKKFDAIPRRTYVLNHDVTYEINRNAFNSALQFVWQLNGSNISASLGVDKLDVAVRKVVRNGMVCRLTFELNGAPCWIETLGKLRTKRHEQQIEYEFTMAWFRPGLDNITAVSGVTAEAAARIVSYTDALLDEFAFTISNGNNIDLKNTFTVYFDDDWLFVGANVEQ